MAGSTQSERPRKAHPALPFASDALFYRNPPHFSICGPMVLIDYEWDSTMVAIGLSCQCHSYFLARRTEFPSGGRSLLALRRSAPSKDLTVLGQERYTELGPNHNRSKCLRGIGYPIPPDQKRRAGLVDGEALREAPSQGHARIRRQSPPSIPNQTRRDGHARKRLL
jgi:hypothetical protein